MDNKFVITIGRQFGSCGKEIGQELAKRFGITFYDKELISLASKESGLCQEFFEKADEKNSGNLLQVNTWIQIVEKYIKCELFEYKDTKNSFT